MLCYVWKKKLYCVKNKKCVSTNKYLSNYPGIGDLKKIYLVTALNGSLLNASFKSTIIYIYNIYVYMKMTILKKIANIKYRQKQDEIQNHIALRRFSHVLTTGRRLSEWWQDSSNVTLVLLSVCH